MADICMSYERSDYAKAQRIAESLGQHGWSVWWDRMLLAGDRFDKAIQQALHTAKHACRLVFLRRVRPHASVALAELRAALEVRRSRNSQVSRNFRLH